MKKTRKPSHPGAFFKHTVLDERNISITDAAINLGITRKALSEFVNGKAKCSHSMARRLAEATGTSVGIWIMMQANLDTWEAENMTLEMSVTPFEERRLA
ncbi:HigA family addiction module antitoxin [Psychromonas aquimarina]|uniref:HigA family addiction module antitoxin n=1 Tax=Psychromonas aquimarina TaxID=444919 RepID=UPI000490D6EC|nr:HigA family addiction module antitoxin [Psychromonas aquimarina]